MRYKKEDLIDCVGAVNVVLDDRVVLQGQIIKERHHHDPINVNVEVESENEFITLELTCDALIIRDNAELKEISPPLFEEGDRVRVNIAGISAIGPSHGCPDDEEVC
ncbi:hypothetical protein [Sporomusa sp.]|uniref:hypothetical protein n=1 Tax=Sporomusa sp. TaxID=2078658 RepID=UPI002D0644C7|nr:hypothetical protein [Sporomusa sp.]HWR43755.1 hypothetical protein [Sporomusa sp.]